MIRYECPNGHVFTSAQTVQCDQCDAKVAVVPLARLIESGGEIERLRGEVKRLREAGEEAIRLLELVPGKRPSPALLEARIELRAALNPR